MPLRSLRRGRLALAGGLLLAAIALAAVLSTRRSGGSSTGGHGGHPVESMFQDDQMLLYEPTPVVVQTLDTLKALGVDRLRVTVLWHTVAPDAASPARPAGFVASDPADYPADGFTLYDRLVLLARARGLTVNFNVTAAGPLWAMRGPPDRPQRAYVYAPHARDFREFVAALGRRYSGSYVPPAAQRGVLAALGVTLSGALPRVSYWSIWNEPNQPGWLSPQWRTLAGRLVPYSPVLYRGYVDAAWRGLTATGHGPSTDTILIGELAPEGGPGEPVPRVEQPIPPMDFLEALYCVGPSFQPLSGSDAAELGCPASRGAGSFAKEHPALFEATGFAHHPYSFFLPPNVAYTAPQDSGFVPLVSLPRLEHGLDRIFAAYGVDRRIPIYLTEYGYETNPPNPFRSVSLAEQAAYIDEAQYMAAQDPCVRALSQFLLRDSPPDSAFPVGSSRYWSTFQTGLEFVNGAEKPSFAAYRLPLWIPSVSGRSVTVWGMIRPARSPQRAVLQWRGASGWRSLATVTVDGQSRTFTAKVTVPGPGAVRVEWSSPSGRAFHSRAVAVG